MSFSKLNRVSEQDYDKLHLNEHEAGFLKS